MTLKQPLCGKVQKPCERAIFKEDPLAPGKSSGDLIRDPELEPPSWISDPQKPYKTINVCWHKLLSFGIICQTAIESNTDPNWKLFFPSKGV